jgi:hypothetical protein
VCRLRSSAARLTQDFTPFEVALPSYRREPACRGFP